MNFCKSHITFIQQYFLIDINWRSPYSTGSTTNNYRVFEPPQRLVVGIYIPLTAVKQENKVQYV
jgi:hypothetical protein